MVLHAIIRKTYGWNIKADWISGSQIAVMTGLSRFSVCKALRNLQARQIILRDGRMLGIHKDYTAWRNVAEIDNVAENNNIDLLPKLAIPLSNLATFVAENYTHKRQKTLIQKTECPRFKIDSSKTHPAVRIYWELTDKRPRRGSLQYDRIVRTVTDNEQKLRHWRAVVEAWLLAGHRDTNVKGMLDWFANGIPVRPGEPPVDADGLTPEMREQIEKSKRKQEEDDAKFGKR